MYLAYHCYFYIYFYLFLIKNFKNLYYYLWVQKFYLFKYKLKGTHKKKKRLKFYLFHDEKLDQAVVLSKMQKNIKK